MYKTYIEKYKNFYSNPNRHGGFCVQTVRRMWGRLNISEGFNGSNSSPSFTSEMVDGLPSLFLPSAVGCRTTYHFFLSKIRVNTPKASANPRPIDVPNPPYVIILYLKLSSLTFFRSPRSRFISMPDSKGPMDFNMSNVSFLLFSNKI